MSSEPKIAAACSVIISGLANAKQKENRLKEFKMSSERKIAAACCVIIGLAEKQKGKRRWWMTSVYESRKIYRETDLLQDLAKQDLGQFHNFCRMSTTDLEWLLNKVGPRICKKSTNFRDPVPVKERLAITLRFLATGDSYTSLMYLFKVSKQLISKIVLEVCAALVEELKEFVQVPSTPDEWYSVSKQYEELWNFPHCLGSIDGKHCILQAPIITKSEFFNYKKSFSIVLLGIVDADYCFIYVNIGTQGRISDGGVFKNTSFYDRLQKGVLGIPNDNILPGRSRKTPYVFVADDAFALQEHILKPFPGIQEQGSKQRIFNYRCSRARRVVENAFGILSARFRVLRKPMLLEPETASIVVQCCVYLHNFLRKSRFSRNYYKPGINEIQYNAKGSSWSEPDEPTSFFPLTRIGRKSSEYCKLIREEFTEYFSSEIGSVPWQNEYA